MGEKNSTRRFEQVRLYYVFKHLRPINTLPPSRLVDPLPVVYRAYDIDTFSPRLPLGRVLFLIDLPLILLVGPLVPFSEINEFVLDPCCSVLIEHLIYCSSETFRVCIRTALVVV